MISNYGQALCVEYANASFDCGVVPPIGDRTDERQWKDAFAKSEASRIALEGYISGLESAIEALPLEDFDKDMDTIDAAEFADHAAEFMEAMERARSARAKARSEA